MPLLARRIGLPCTLTRASRLLQKGTTTAPLALSRKPRGRGATAEEVKQFSSQRIRAKFTAGHPQFETFKVSIRPGFFADGWIVQNIHGRCAALEFDAVRCDV
jgi:hypothetical protein